MAEFECKRCGTCCLSVDHIDIEDADIQRWMKAGREDLFTPDMLIEWDYFGASGLYRNQSTARCPFLRKTRNEKSYYCTLHKDNLKPNVCRNFPLTRKHAQDMGCKGFE